MSVDASSSRRSVTSTPSSQQDSQQIIPPRPTRTEYASYYAMIRDLDAREHGNLARRLAGSQGHELDSSTVYSTPSGERSTPRETLKHEKPSTRWPLGPEELPELPTSLDDAIRSFAFRHIRSRGLTPNVADSVSTLLDEDLLLPPSLVLSTREFINRILVGLAGMRPVDVAKKRKCMDRIGWEGVVGAASMMCEYQS